MSNARMIVVFAAGCGLMYLLDHSPLSGTIERAASSGEIGSSITSTPPASTLGQHETKPTANFGGDVPAPRDPAIAQSPDGRWPQYPELPPAIEMEKELTRYGVTPDRARAMLEAFGPVKINSLLQRERQILAKQGKSPKGTSPSPDAGAESVPAESSATADSDNPYLKLKRELAARAPGASGTAANTSAKAESAAVAEATACAADACSVSPQ